MDLAQDVEAKLTISMAPYQRAGDREIGGLHQPYSHIQRMSTRPVSWPAAEAYWNRQTTTTSASTTPATRNGRAFGGLGGSDGSDQWCGKPLPLPVCCYALWPCSASSFS
jgi:hypothetical protein